MSPWLPALCPCWWLASQPHNSLPTTTLVPWAGERCLCPQENHAGGGTRVAQWWGRPPPGYTKPSLRVLRALGDSWEVALGLNMCNPSFPLKQKARLSAFVHARKLNMWTEVTHLLRLNASGCLWAHLGSTSLDRGWRGRGRETGEG